MCDISYWYRCQTLQLFTVYQLKCTSGKTVIFPHVEMWLGNKCSGVLLHYVWQWMMILNKAASEWTCINSRTSVVTLSQSPPQEPTQQRRFFSKWTERGTPDGRQKPTCQVVLLFFFHSLFFFFFGSQRPWRRLTWWRRTIWCLRCCEVSLRSAWCRGGSDFLV